MRLAMIFTILAALGGCTLGAADSQIKTAAPKPRATVGAYYFDGWGGHRRGRGDAVSDPNAPMMLTERLAREFPGREPVWGWRDDSVEVMERQIDLAADAGVKFFAFCWYWFPTQAQIDASPLNEPIGLFLKARNHNRMKFCMLVANHKPYDPPNDEAWKKIPAIWMPWLKDPSALTIDGKPAVIFFNPSNGTRAAFDNLQNEAKKAGLPGVAIVACGKESAKLGETGYTHRTWYNIIPGYWGGSSPHPFKELVDAHEKEWNGSPEQPFIPEVTAGWDKRPWESDNPPAATRPNSTAPADERAWYFPDRTPAQVASFLEDAIRWMDSHPAETTRERLVLVYAWNELGEGGIIAPTKDDPHGEYLKAIRSVVYGAQTPPAKTQP